MEPMSSPSSGFHADDVALHSEWMRRLARGLVGDASAADDVVQDVWTRLAGERVQAGYLAAVVRSLAGRRRRSEQRRWRRERNAARDEALPSTAEVAARSEIARKLAEAVERLEEPYRTTLVLRYYDDLQAAEIARRAGIPASTVRARLKRGLEILRARLDEGDGGRASWVCELLPLAQVRVEAPAALAASLTTLVAMKLALVSILAVCGLALVWTALSVGDDAPPSLGTSPEAGRERALLAEEDGEPRPIGFAEASREEVALARPRGADESAPVAPSATCQVRARVVDRAGSPVRNAWLRLRHLPDDAASDDGAGFLALSMEPAELERLAGLGNSRAVEVEVGATGHRTRCLRHSLREGATTLELGDVVLLPGGVLNGRVVDETGLGVEGALVAFGMPSEAQPGDPRMARRGPGDLDPYLWDGRDPALVTTSGPGGGFRLEGLAAGYGTAWARTATSLWAFSEPIGLREGEEVSGVELVVGDAPEEVITGNVVDPDGRPLPGLGLRFSRSDKSDGWWVQRTDSRGGFHFVPMDGTAQDIGASSPSWDWEDQKRTGVAPGTHDLVIAFERSRWLQVAVLDPAGQSVRNGRVVGLPGSGPTQHALSRCESPLDESGHARIRRPDAALRVRVEAPGYRDRIVGPIDPGLFPDPLTVMLEPVPALIGQVLLADGRPAAGASVSLHRGAGASVGTRAPGGTAQAERSYLSHQGWSGDRDAFVYELMADPVARVTADGEGRFRLPLPGVDTSAQDEVEAGDEGWAGSATCTALRGRPTRRTRMSPGTCTRPSEAKRRSPAVRTASSRRAMSSSSCGFRAEDRSGAGSCSRAGPRPTAGPRAPATGWPRWRRLPWDRTAPSSSRTCTPAAGRCACSSRVAHTTSRGGACAPGECPWRTSRSPPARPSSTST
jgi:RNA polymerase sigma factor (sigma-70 family)